MQALWNETLLQSVGCSTYSHRPFQQLALLDCKDTYFTLCGRKPDWGAASYPWHEEPNNCMEKTGMVLLAAYQEVHGLEASSLKLHRDSSELASRSPRTSANALRSLEGGQSTLLRAGGSCMASLGSKPKVEGAVSLAPLAGTWCISQRFECPPCPMDTSHRLEDNTRCACRASLK